MAVLRFFVTFKEHVFALITKQNDRLVCVYIYIYVYVYRERARERERVCVCKKAYTVILNFLCFL